MTFAKKVIQHFLASNTFQEGAALAYYTVFSILPMIVLVISIFGLVWGEAAVSGDVYQSLNEALGHEAALQIQDIVKQQHLKHNSLWTTIMGGVTLALGASGMFNQLHSSFNSIWQVGAQAKSGLLAYFSKHAISLGLLITTFFLMLVSLTMNSFLVQHSDTISADFPLGVVSEHLLSLGVLTLAFALMFRYLGDANMPWRVVLVGGLFTAVLFTVGKSLIGWYIGNSSIGSTFGAASVLALLMIWVYYTSQILFLGASFVYVLATQRTGGL